MKARLGTFYLELFQGIQGLAEPQLRTTDLLCNEMLRNTRHLIYLFSDMFLNKFVLFMTKIYSIGLTHKQSHVCQTSLSFFLNKDCFVI